MNSTLDVSLPTIDGPMIVDQWIEDLKNIFALRYGHMPSVQETSLFGSFSTSLFVMAEEHQNWDTQTLYANLETAYNSILNSHELREATM